MINKKYREGAENVADIAAVAFSEVGGQLEGIEDSLRINEDKRYQLGNEFIDIAKNHEQRLREVEYHLPAIDFCLADSLSADKRALLGGIIRSIFLPTDDCKKTADLIISRLGAEPLADINGEQIGRLDLSVQRLCTYYLFLLLRRTNGHEMTEQDVTGMLDEFLVSNKEKQLIKSVIDKYDVAEIDELIRIRSGGKQNIIVMGKSEAIPAGLINSVLGECKVNQGFHHKVGVPPTALETNESPIRFCGVFMVGYDTALNSSVLGAAKDVIRTRVDTNRISNIWYCVNARSDRMEKNEIMLINNLHHSFPDIRIIVVFTNCISKKAAEELAGKTNRFVCNTGINYVSVLTESVNLDNGETIAPYGIDELVNITLCKNTEDE